MAIIPASAIRANYPEYLSVDKVEQWQTTLLISVKKTVKNLSK